jgi:hypothetical protein
MKTINLKDYYDHIVIDTYIDIPDEVFDIFEEYRKAEQAYQSRIRYSGRKPVPQWHPWIPPYVMDWLNNYPRRILGWRTSAQLFEEFLATVA